MTRILIVDDHQMFRLGIRAAIEPDPDIEIVGEARDGAEAVAMAADLSPDCILMDLSMPEMDGIEATRRIAETHPHIKILMLTTFAGSEDVHNALEAGASGYLSKQLSNEDLVSALKRTLIGDQVVSDDAQRKLAARQAADPLTPREREVLSAIVKGYSNKEVGDSLSIAERTVKIHVNRILRKLGVLDRTQAALLAVKEGLVRERD